MSKPGKKPAARKPKPSPHLLRVVDRGELNGVPVVDVYLVARSPGGSESGLMHSTGLSPKSADELAGLFKGWGLRVEREKRG